MFPCGEPSAVLVEVLHWPSLYDLGRTSPLQYNIHVWITGFGRRHFSTDTLDLVDDPASRQLLEAIHRLGSRANIDVLLPAIRLKVEMRPGTDEDQLHAAILELLPAFTKAHAPDRSGMINIVDKRGNLRNH